MCAQTSPDAGRRYVVRLKSSLLTPASFFWTFSKPLDMPPAPPAPALVLTSNSNTAERVCNGQTGNSGEGIRGQFFFFCFFFFALKTVS